MKKKSGENSKTFGKAKRGRKKGLFGCFHTYCIHLL
jgi:hypothetical protein